MDIFLVFLLLDSANLIGFVESTLFCKLESRELREALLFAKAKRSKKFCLGASHNSFFRFCESARNDGFFTLDSANLPRLVDLSLKG